LVNEYYDANIKIGIKEKSLNELGSTHSLLQSASAFGSPPCRKRKPKKKREDVIIIEDGRKSTLRSKSPSPGRTLRRKQSPTR